MLSTDHKILDEKSAVYARMLEYATTFGNLYLLLISKKFKTVNFKIQINENLTIHHISFWQALTWSSERQVIFDIVTAQDPFEIGFIGWRIARKIGVRVQLQIHTDFLSPYFTKYSVLNRIRVQLAKFLLPKADSIRVVSHRIKDSLKTKNYQLKTTPVVLPIYVATEKFRNASITIDLHKKYPQFEKIILMASRLTKEKNIGLAIDAMREVVAQNPTVGLVIVGSGPEESVLKLKTKNYQLQNSVIFESWTNDLPSYYRTADLFLNTSWYEGYGMVFIEAAACATPIISNDVGIATEVGAMIVGWNASELSQAIISSFDSPQKPTLPSLLTKEEYLKKYKKMLIT